MIFHSTYFKLGWCECVWEGGVVGTWVLHSKRSPKCGIFSSKLRSPVCKERRRRWGCGSVRAVSVWPAHVTCLLLRALAVAKEQVTKATVVAMEQVLMAVVRDVSWCKVVVWWGTFTGITGRCAELCSHPCLWFSPPLTKGTDPEVCFLNMAKCKSHIRASLWESGANKSV